jgi:hypothetical protein
MGKKIKAPNTPPFANAPAKLVLTDAPDDWLSLVEQIAELEDILLECGAAQDQDADHGRAWLHDLLLDKRRQLRRIEVAV